MIEVEAVQYPYIITKSGKKILILDIEGFVKAPCFIEEIAFNKYKVVTGKVKPPTNDCGV